MADPFPIKRLYNKLENSIQTYVNYHKTHAMATHYGGVGDTSMENPKNRDLDNDSQNNFQDENIITQLFHKTEQLRQAIEDRDNDPMDVVHQLGHVVSKEDIQTDPKEVEAICKWPIPTNMTEVRSFLGFTNYY